MNNRPPIYKRSLLIDRSIQVPLLLYTLCMATIGIALVVGLSAYWTLLMPQSTSPWVSPILMAGGALFAYAIMVLLGLYVTNRVAGPLHRLKEHMEAVTKGENPGPLEPRKDDYVNQELIEQYNKLIEAFSKK